MRCALPSSPDLLLGEKYEKGNDARNDRKGYRDPFLGLGPFFYGRPPFLAVVVVVEVVRMTASICLNPTEAGEVGAPCAL